MKLERLPRFYLLLLRNRPESIEFENPGICACAGDDGLHRRHPALRAHRQLLMDSNAITGAIGSQTNHHTRVVDRSEISAVEFEELSTSGSECCQIP